MPSTRSARERAQARLFNPTGPKQFTFASDQQKEAWDYGPAPLCLSGGFGAAKTYIALMKLFLLACDFPGSRWMIARMVFEELKKTTLATLQKIIPYPAFSFGGHWSVANKSIKLNNGSEFILLHFADDDIESILGGLEINGFAFDQAEELPETLFDKLQARLNRWDRVIVSDEIMRAYGFTRETWPYWNGDNSIPLPPPYQILTVNPAGFNHWIWRRFHADSPDHVAKRPMALPDGTPTLASYKDVGYRMITMDSTKNKFLPKHTKAAMLSGDESFVRRYVRGEWGFHEGTIHHINSMSLLPGTTQLLSWVRNNCLLFRTHDHGDSSPAAMLWVGVDSRGNVFFYREYEVGNRLISKHRAEMTAMSENETYIYSLSDPSIFRKAAQKDGAFWSVADEYNDRIGLPAQTAILFDPADNNELATRNRINEYLNVDPSHPHPFTGVLGAPHAYFITRTPEYPLGCYKLMVEIKSQSRVKTGTLMGAPVYSDEREPNNEDHLYDCFRYAIASRPPLAPVDTGISADGNTFNEWRKLTKSVERERSRPRTSLHARRFTSGLK